MCMRITKSTVYSAAGFLVCYNIYVYNFKHMCLGSYGWPPPFLSFPFPSLLFPSFSLLPNKTWVGVTGHANYPYQIWRDILISCRMNNYLFIYLFLLSSNLMTFFSSFHFFLDILFLRLISRVYNNRKIFMQIMSIDNRINCVVDTINKKNWNWIIRVALLAYNS